MFKHKKRKDLRVLIACAAVLLALSLAAGCTNVFFDNNTAQKAAEAGKSAEDSAEALTAGTGESAEDSAEALTAGTGENAEDSAEALTAGTGESADHSAEALTAAAGESTDQSAETPDAGAGGTEEDSAEAMTAGAGEIAEVSQEDSRAKETRENEETEITFTAVGDNLINEVLYRQAAERAAEKGEEGRYDFSPCYAQMAPFIQEHDVNWIDIETLMTDSCEPSGYPCFSTPGDSGRALIDAGWNVFSICSNHTYDQGAYGIGESLAFWKQMKEETRMEDEAAAEEKDKAAAEEKDGEEAEEQDEADGICTTGLWEYGTEYEIPVLTCKGKKLAFLTYTYGTNNIPTPDGAAGHVIYLDEEGLMEEQIQLAREQADAVIVSLHWGEEYNHYETQEQRDLAQRVADMGADLIIGGHPHVVEGAEMLTAEDGRKVFCAYSLGNFICAQNSMPDPDTMIGLLLSCTFRFTQEGLSVEDHKLVPILSDYGDGYADDHVVLYSEYSQEEALAHGMRNMFGFTQFDYDYVRQMLTEVVGTEYLELP